MLTQEEIEKITSETIEFLLKRIENLKIGSQQITTLSSSIASSIIFNLCNASIKGDKEVQRVFYAMAMWSINKNIYKALEASDIDDGKFSMIRKTCKK